MYETPEPFPKPFPGHWLGVQCTHPQTLQVLTVGPEPLQDEHPHTDQDRHGDSDDGVAHVQLLVDSVDIVTKITPIITEWFKTNERIRTERKGLLTRL